jgi:hypothetical protein
MARLAHAGNDDTLLAGKNRLDSVGKSTVHHIAQLTQGFRFQGNDLSPHILVLISGHSQHLFWLS